MKEIYIPFILSYNHIYHIHIFHMYILERKKIKNVKDLKKLKANQAKLRPLKTYALPVHSVCSRATTYNFSCSSWNSKIQRGMEEVERSSKLGWRILEDGSIDKGLAWKAWGPEYDSPEPM